LTVLETLPRAFALAPVRPRLRESPEDFRVEEIALAQPVGNGQHVWLQIEKRGCNTEWVARQLASLAGVSGRDVGFAGMKDRNAVATQWFSVDLKGGAEPDWDRLDDALTLRACVRHRVKLRRGALGGNRFQIVLRGFGIAHRAWLEARVAKMAVQGVPNYFGPQRFGQGGANLEGARALFGGASIRSRHKRGLYLSAARAHIFNQVLARRVALGEWDVIVPGDAVMARGNARAFLHHQCREAQEGLLERQRAAGQLHPSGPLWGRGVPGAVGYARALELDVAERFGELTQGLARAGLDQERRALRLMVADIEFRWLSASEEGDVVISFSLPKGCFATSVLRELSCEEAR